MTPNSTATSSRNCPTRSCTWFAMPSITASKSRRLAGLRERIRRPSSFVLQLSAKTLLRIAPLLPISSVQLIEVCLVDLRVYACSYCGSRTSKGSAWNSNESPKSAAWKLKRSAAVGTRSNVCGALSLELSSPACLYPDWSAPDLSEQIQRVRPEVAVIIRTPGSTLSEAVRFVKLGAYSVLKLRNPRSH